MQSVQNHHDLIDLAGGKSWHHLPDDENGEVRVAHERMIRPRADAKEGSTRLQIDLGLRFPIHKICVSSGLGMTERAQFALSVAFSDDGRDWWLPELSPDAENGRSSYTVGPAGRAPSWARHIQISTDDPDLSGAFDAKVWGKQSDFDLIVFRRLTGADFDIISEKADKDVYRCYNFVGAEHIETRSLVGIAPYENGAFGNCLIQYILAIGIAKNFNLKYIKLPRLDRSEVISLIKPLHCDGITFIPANDPLPSDGYFLSGMFFDIPIQNLAGTLEQKETREIVKSYIRPLFNKLPTYLEKKPTDQLLIHIRSGDIFSTWVAPHYPQPPLAFYQLVIQRLMAEKRITSIKMVFENRLNPVIAELEAYISRIGIPLTTQSGSLVDDVAALIDGSYLVFGLGTFGPAVCQLSNHIEQVFYFSSGWPQHFKGIPTIGKIVEVIDLKGAYTKVGEWDNSPERRKLMSDYPIESLAFDDVSHLT